MFALNKFANKITEIQWKFDIGKKEDYEKLLFVKFKQNEKGYFTIEHVLYTYIDILMGLEELNFVVCKVKNDVTLEIVS